MNSILTPQVITAVLSLIATLIISQVPQFADQINQIAALIGVIAIGLIGGQTANDISKRQEATKIEAAKIQAAAVQSARNLGRE